MIFGFNTDVKFGETVYHVQSEARSNECLLQSQIFVKGRCIGKRATPYEDTGEQAGSEDRLHELLKDQHRRLVEAVRAGRIEEELDAEPAVAPPPPPVMTVTPLSLDDFATEVAAAEVSAAPGSSAPAAAPTASMSLDDFVAEVAAAAASAGPSVPAAAPTKPLSLDELAAEVSAAAPAPSAPAAAPPLDDLAAEFAAAVADKPADPGVTLNPLSGVIGKGLSLECLPPSCGPDSSAVLICVQVAEEGGAPASGAQLTCRITSGQGPASYAYATAGASGIADLRIVLQGLDLNSAALLLQASHRGKSASRKFALRRAT